VLSTTGAEVSLDLVAGSAARDRINRGVDDEDPTAERVVLEGLHVPGPDPHQGTGFNRGLGGAGRGQHHPLGPREQPGGDFEGGILFADDEDALARVRGGILHLGVVGDEVEARRTGAPWFRHAHGENHQWRAVFTVAGDHDEAIALVPGRLPAAAESDRYPGPIGEFSQPLLHLLPGGEVGGAVHELRLHAAELFFLAEQAVPVVALVLARAPVGRVRRVWSS